MGNCPECGRPLIHRRGSSNWECDNPRCTIWSVKYTRRPPHKIVKITHIALPRKHPLPINFDIIGEIS